MKTGYSVYLEKLQGLLKQMSLVKILPIESYSNQRINKANEITFEEIGHIIQNNNQKRYDQMIILNEDRATFYVVKHQVYTLNREVKDVEFYLNNNLKFNFNSGFIGKDKEIKAFTTLPFSPSEIRYSNTNSDYQKSELSFYNLPIEHTNSDISVNQPFYCLTEKSQVITCKNCFGQKYISCVTCSGQHKYKCDNCNNGKINCSNCHTSGYITCSKCSGSSIVACSNCSGSGKVMVTITCKQCNGKGQDCTNCKGAGRTSEIQNCTKCNFGKTQCTNCNNGRVKCNKCDSHGYLTCSKCSGSSYLYCSECYGDINNREKYGKVDCNTCRAFGELGKMTYVETTITVHKSTSVLPENHIFSEDVVTEIKGNIHHNSEMVETFFELYNEKKESHTDFSKQIVVAIRNKLPLFETSYPKLLKEDLYFEAIPCTVVDYKHILSNTDHKVIIVGIDNNPSVVYFSNPKENTQLTTISQSTNLSNRAFNNSLYIKKLDKRNEIILMIYMAKCDGKIENQEKVILSKYIQNLDNFTKNEQDYIFSLMDKDILPVLENRYAVFSSTTVSNEVKNKLIELISKADSKFEDSEKAEFEKISSLIEASKSEILTPFSGFISTWQISIPIFIVIVVIIGLIISN